MTEERPRPNALKNMLIGRTKNDELKLQSVSLCEYHTEKEKKAIISSLIAQGRLLRLS